MTNTDKDRSDDTVQVAKADKHQEDAVEDVGVVETPMGDRSEDQPQPDAPEPSQSRTDGDFSVENLLKHFSDCIGVPREDDYNLNLNSYLLAFDEIYKFLNLLGTVFGWVASDVAQKVDVLRGHQNSEHGQHYESIRGLVEHEVGADLIRRKSKDSGTGSRNLLRLHRALEYITMFLNILPDIDNTDKCCPASQAAYKRTLIKYHPWVVQKAALMAMHMLPTKEGLIHKFCGDTEADYQRAVDTISLAVDKMQLVYIRTHDIFNAHNLLDLP